MGRTKCEVQRGNPSSGLLGFASLYPTYNLILRQLVAGLFITIRGIPQIWNTYLAYCNNFIVSPARSVTSLSTPAFGLNRPLTFCNSFLIDWL